MMNGINRFTLEEQIMNCWIVTDDINTIYKYVGDHPDFKDMNPKHCDKICNLLLGLHTLYNVKFDEMFRTFEHLIHDGTIK